MKNSDSDEDSVLIRDKPLKLQMKNKVILFYKNRKVLIKNMLDLGLLC